jgi:diguanylate cyclase (GGDEF)-like protein
MVQVLSSITILIVNLITTDFLSKHKYNHWVTYGMMVIFTGLVFLITQLVIPSININMPQSLILLLFAWVYIILFINIYTHSIKTLIIIMAFSLSHTMLVNGFVFHLHEILFSDTSLLSILYIQWIIFCITTPLIIMVLKSTYKEIIHDLDQLKFMTAILLPVINFLVLFTIRFFINFNNITISIAFYVLMISTISLSYYIIYQVFNNSLNINHLSNIAYKDTLTSIKNRQALYNDFETICKDNRTCNFYYLDLDNLKSINDQYGHLEGDQYIIDFTNAVKKAINNHGFYRISGDEFVLVKHKEPIPENDIENAIRQSFSSKHQFLGVSVGMVSYPHETYSLDQLLNIADQRMYHYKQSKND